ncbi:MAG TPA: ABC transporter permease [Candidatus Baltobacteraceae bacterium]
MNQYFATIYRYRWLIYELVLRNLRLRYRGSILGFAWTLANPLLFMAVYTLVFSVILKNGMANFPLYLLAGIVPWTWFASGLAQGATSILDGRLYVGKTLFPSEVLVVVPVLTNGVNFALSLPFIAIVALLLHVHLGWSLLMLPVVVLVELILLQGLATLFATVNVFYRDVNELLTYAITALMFLTPIFYTQSLVATHVPQMAGILALNPLAGIIAGFQAILYGGAMPDLKSLAYSAIVGFVLLATGQWVFERYRESFSEFL